MIAPASAGPAWPALYESGRLLCTAQPGVADYATRALLVPYGRRRRAVLPMLRRLPASVRRRAAVRMLVRSNGRTELWQHAARNEGAADQMAMLAVALHEMPVLLAGTPLHDWDGTHWIALRDYDGVRQRGRLVLFLFRAGAVAPAAVLKLRRTERGGRSLSAEYDALCRLRAGAPGDGAFADALPQPLVYREHAGLEALLLSALPGPSADVLLRTDPYRRSSEHLRAGLEWLARFHRATRHEPGCSPGETERARALYRIQQLDDDAPLRPLATALRSHDVLPLSMAAGHGDFWPRNVIAREDRRGVGVVDWEHFTEAAPCAVDVFHFVITWTLRSVAEAGVLHDTSAAATFAAVMNDRKRCATIRSALEHYCATAGLPHEELRAALPLYLLIRPLDQSGHDDDGWTRYAARLGAGETPTFLP